MKTRKTLKTLKAFSTYAISTCCIFTAQNSFADTLLGLYAEADYWSASLDGEFGNGDSNGFFKSFSGDSGTRDQHAILSAHFEHGIPFLPNVWLRKNNINYEDAQNLSSSINVGSATFDTSSPVNYRYDLSHTDAALYYEILDNWITFDIGLGVKSIQFEYDLRQGGQAYTFEESSTIPMLYGKAAFELPFSGWQITTQAMALSFEDDRIEDMNIELGYNFNDFFQVAAGYRQITIDINTQAVAESKMTLDGSYLSFIIHL